MWKFIKGATNPAETRKAQKQTREHKLQYYKNYDRENRDREFSHAWLDGRPWLKNTVGGMVCTFCQEFSPIVATEETGNAAIGKKKKKISEFVKGCNSYKLDSVTKHEESKRHNKCALLHEAKVKPRGESAAAKIIQTLNKDSFDKLDKLFRTCHALVLHNRPLSDFVWTCQLDDMKGVTLGNTYRNTVSAKAFLAAMSEIEFDHVKQVVDKESKFVCVIGDGSTDSSIKEQEMWFIRMSNGGKIKTMFIGVAATDKANAQNICIGLQELVEKNLQLDWHIFLQKVVALSCDGASVMTGVKNGVGAILRHDQPSLVTIHCMAHRLELSLKDTAKQIKLYEKTMTTLVMGLYFFYHNSSLNRSMLKRSYDALKTENDGPLLLPVRAGGTRWIGHALRAVTNIVSSYKYITAHLGQLTEPTERVSSDAKAKAVAFLRLLRSKDVVCFLMFLRDVMTPLRHMSLELQDRTSTVAKQHQCIGSTLEMVRKYQDRLWRFGFGNLVGALQNTTRTLQH